MWKIKYEHPLKSGDVEDSQGPLLWTLAVEAPSHLWLSRQERKSFVRSYQEVVA